MERDCAHAGGRGVDALPPDLERRGPDQRRSMQWEIALLVLFLLALILAFMQFFRERQALGASSSSERFPEPALAKFFLASEGSAAM